MDTKEVLNVADVLTVARLETLWPETERKIYCTYTGQPWATLTGEELARIAETYSFTEREDVKFSRQVMRLTAGPCPRWNSTTPVTLQRNIRHDPRGSFVFLLGKAFGVDRQNKRGQQFSRGLQSLRVQLDRQWFYSATAEIDIGYIIEINEILLIMYAETMLPSPALDGAWTDFINNNAITALAFNLHKIAEKRRKQRKSFDDALKRSQRAIFKGLVRVDLTNVSDRASDKIMDALLEDIANSFEARAENTNRFNDPVHKAVPVDPYKTAALHGLTLGPKKTTPVYNRVEPGTPIKLTFRSAK